MKKLVVTLLMIVYTLSSTGATLHLHYCCGKFENISLSVKHNPDCPQKESIKKECCDSKQVDLKIKADQEPGAKWLSLNKEWNISPWAATTYTAIVPIKAATLQVFTTGPPPLASNARLYIKNRA